MDTNNPAGEPDDDFLCLQKRRGLLPCIGSRSVGGRGEMTLSSHHYTTISTLYRGLKESNPGLAPLPADPANFRWRYLSADNYQILGLTEWTNDGVPIVSIHPFAFTPSWEFVLLGLLNHELSHLAAGPEAGHGPIFDSIEQGWSDHNQWIGERREFVAFVHGEVKANIENLRHHYRCPSCSRIVKCKQKLSPGAACYVCCALNNAGRWLKSAVLIWEGLQPTHNPESDDAGGSEQNEQNESN